MDKKMINQKEYLRKYLSSGKDKKNKKVKKKKPNVGSKTVTIIDDDIDLNSMRPIEDGEFDIYINTEDGPQIAGIVDERGPVDFSDTKRWRIITDDQNSHESEKICSGKRNLAEYERGGDQSSRKDRYTGRNGRDKEASVSPERRKKNDKKRGEKDSRRDNNSSEPSEKIRSRKRNLAEYERGGDQSSRKDRYTGRNGRDKEASVSPERRKKNDKKREKDSRRDNNSSEPDLSPPRENRKKRKELDSESSLVQKNNKNYQVMTAGRNGRDKEASVSPERRKKNDKKRREKDSRRDNNSSEPDLSPPRENRNKRKELDSESSLVQKNNKNYQVMTAGRNHRGKEASVSPERRKKNDKKRGEKDSRRDNNSSESDLSPPRENRNKRKELDSESSLVQKNNKNYQVMTAETSGFGQAPILRDRKTGRRRDLAAEARDKAEKDEKRQELEEKYAQWGKGLKQVEDRQQKLDRDLYEMSKPLARYADDADLERELKAQEREGDPMLAYMKRKHIKEGKQEPEKPKYSGPFMPNRFGIRPGYRWDGVDRSNGYEKKWFDAQNARKAVQEEAYKWSTADM